MESVALTEKQRKRIRHYIIQFRKYLDSPEGRRDTEDRISRRQFFRAFTAQRLAQLEEAELGELISRLWASKIFTNKRYILEVISKVLLSR